MPNPCNVLKITDGTTSVNLLNPAYGIHLAEWNPQIQQPKGGGVFQDSPLAPGRQRVYSQTANAIEAFEFKVDSLNQNQVLGRLTTLITLLEGMVEYWETEYNNTPVYLEVQTEDGNTQYAIIKSYTFLGLDNPFAQPFLPFLGGNSVMDELDLQVERGDWLALPPTQTEAVSILIRNNEYSSGGLTYIPAIYTPTEITHIYVDDGGVFGSNQAASTSFNLLPAAPAVNDAIYFGNDSNQPLYAIAFDLNSVFAGTVATGVWEEFRSGSWGAMPITRDETNSLKVTGVNSFYYTPSTIIAPTTINGVSGLWIRFRVTGATGIISVPSQQNRIVYCINNPTIEYENSTTAFGDLPSLIKATLVHNGSTTSSAYRDFFFMCKSNARGSNFYPWINISSVDQISGIAISVNGGVGMAEAAAYFRPTGNAMIYDASTDGQAAGTNIRRFSIAFDTTISPSYIPGSYHIYFVISGNVGSTSGNSTFTSFLRLEDSTRSVRYWQSSNVEFSLSSTTNYARLDFGEMTLPFLPGNTNLTLDFYFATDVKTDDLSFISVLVMPTDEWAMMGHFALGGASGTFAQIDGDHYLIANGTDPKNPLQTSAYYRSNDNFYGPLASISNNSMILKENSKLWIFALDEVNNFIAVPFRVTLEKVNRYKSLRGGL